MRNLDYMCYRGKKPYKVIYRPFLYAVGYSLRIILVLNYNCFQCFSVIELLKKFNVYTFQNCNT